MTLLNIIVLAATLLVGVLLGSTLAERLLTVRARQQAAMQRRLNSQWQELQRQRTNREAAQHLAESPEDDDPRVGFGDVDSDPAPVLSAGPRAGSSPPTRADTVGPGRGSRQTSQKSGKFTSEPVWSTLPREGRGQDSLVRTTLPITIYLSYESVHEQVEAAVEDLVATVGGHIEHRDDPVPGSWFRRMRARISQAVHSPLGHEAAILAAHAAESHLVLAQDATITATMLQNLGPVLTALQPTKDAVIRAGALLIVKLNSTVVIHQLTAAQQLRLDHQPQLAQSPHDILSALQLPPGSSPPSAEEGVNGTRQSNTAPWSPRVEGYSVPPSITSHNGDDSTPLNIEDHRRFPESTAGA